MLLSLGLAAVAVVAVAGAARPAPLAALPLAPWWLFAGLFAITEACVVQLRLRREAFSLSLSEAPLVIGLFLATPGELLLGRALGSALVFVAHRRQRPIKAGFNTALVMAGTAVAISILRVLLPAGCGGFGPAGWAAALTATIGAGVLDSLALSLVIGWYTAPMGGRALLAEIASSVAVSTAVGGAGLLAVAAVRGGQATVPLAVAGGLVVLGYRSFAALADRHTSLERLYELSDSLAATPEWNDVLASVLRRSSDLLRAGYVEVLLAGHGPGRAPTGPQRWSLRAGGGEGDADGRVEGPEDAAALAGVGIAFPPPRPLLLRPDADAARAFLGVRGLREALVVPLRVDDRAVGHIVVGDRTGEAKFVPGDVRLLETVANHGSVALRNGRLIERLHFEARHDELTGLPNRLHFRELLERRGRRRPRRGPPCAVMVHRLRRLQGDQRHARPPGGGRAAAGARRPARRRRRPTRPPWPGSAATSSRCSPRAAHAGRGRRAGRPAARRVRRAGRRWPAPGCGSAARSGSRSARSTATTGSDLLRNADIAMYAAKTAAGGRRMFSPDLSDHQRASA